MMNFDKLGVVVHADGDQGDSCADTFRYWYARRLNGSNNGVGVLRAVEIFFKAGIGIRHPEPPYNEPSTGKFAFSRDQMRAAIVCLHAYDYVDVLDHIKARMQSRGWRYQNGEIAWPDHRAEFDPGSRSRLADVSILIASIFVVLHSWWDSKMSCDDINHINSLIQFKLAKNTRLIRLACKVYTFRRRGPIWALRDFYDIDNPEIGTLMEAPVRSIIMGEKV